MKRVAIVDYGLGNLRSVFRGLEKAGGTPIITADASEVRSGDGVVLPGVGAFREGMERLGDLRAAVEEAASEVPLLGICLGMQMLLEFSEEHGLHEGLGMVPGRVRRFSSSPGYKVPHMGWNSLSIMDRNDPLLAGVPDQCYVYFVHSYFAQTTPAYTLTTTDYCCGFASAVRNGTVYGVQFHPEKSGDTGIRILRNFIGLL